MSSKTAGILGGMGPLSTVELLRKIINLTPATVEQDHIHMLVDNRPQIPDRTCFILGEGPSPLPWLRESARKLELWGADFLAIACNTAHYFIAGIQAAVNIPVLNMLQLLAEALKQQYPAGTPLGLLATSGSLRSRIFQNYLAGFSVILPPEEVQQERVMRAIYGNQGIKAGGDMAANQQRLLEAVEILQIAGAACIVAGCTEIGMALEEVPPAIPIINPLDILAKQIVSEAFF